MKTTKGKGNLAERLSWKMKLLRRRLDIGIGEAFGLCYGITGRRLIYTYRPTGIASSRFALLGTGTGTRGNKGFA
jgi:hypothetical protein